MPKHQLASGLGRLKQASGHEPPLLRPVAAEEAKQLPVKNQKRSNLVQIAGHFDVAVSQQLKMIGIPDNRTTQDMLAEALNDLFVKYNYSAIATVYGKDARNKARSR